MAAPILTATSVVTCAHGGVCTPAPAGARVLVGGAPPVLASAQLTVAGCPVTPPVSPPDASAQFVAGLSTRVKVGGVPVALASSAGLAQPTGAPLLVVTAQPRVQAT